MSKQKRRNRAAVSGPDLRAVPSAPAPREAASAPDPRPSADTPAGGTTLEVTPRRLGLIVGALALLAVAVLAGMGRLALPTVPEVDAGASLWLVFLTGLSVGGLSCLAVQGGLLAAMIAQRESHLLDVGGGRPREHVLPVVLFLVAKVIAYTLLGAVLGLFGSRIPLGWQGWVMIAVGVFMIVTALQMYDVHPALRRLTFSPPKSVQRLVRQQSRRGDAVAPLALGALTVFIPCGVTIAMEFLAVASHSATQGAAIMLAFMLGTLPLFLIVGIAATQMGRTAYRVFKPIAAVTVVAIALVSIVSGARLLGFGSFTVRGEAAQAVVVEPGAPAPDAPTSLTPGAGDATGSAGNAGPGGASIAGAEPPAPTGVYQEATINVMSGAYSPARLQIKAGVPTRLRLVTRNTQGCIRAFVIPSLGIERVLSATGTEIVDLPAAAPGEIDFMCSMGMYSGVIEVGDSL